MSRSRHLPLYVLGFITVTVVGWIGLAPAKSGASRHEMERSCDARVKELEAEVLTLRRQLHELAARQGNLPMSMTRSVKKARMSAGAISKADPAPQCDPPFNFDQHGIKYYRPGCLDAEEPDSCSVPYVYSASGIKTYKPDCLDRVPSALTSCESPYSFDARGIKSIKPECL